MGEPEKSVSEAASVPTVTKRMIVDSLVLAFAHSDAKDIVGTDALRMVLDARYPEMVKRQGTLDLQPVWQLLSSQPGFQAEGVTAPFCRFKMWEPQLGIQIVLPTALASVGKLDLSSRAAKCRVPDGALAKILNPTAAAAPGPQPQPTVAPTAESVEEVEQQGRRFKWALGAAIVAVIAVGFSVALALSTQVKTLQPKAFAGTIPVREARMAGDAVGAVLSEGSWLQGPESERRKQVEEAMGRLAALGISNLIIMDPEGRIRVQASGNKITFVRR